MLLSFRSHRQQNIGNCAQTDFILICMGYIYQLSCDYRQTIQSMSIDVDSSKISMNFICIDQLWEAKRAHARTSHTTEEISDVITSLIHRDCVRNAQHTRCGDRWQLMQSIFWSRFAIRRHPKTRIKSIVPARRAVFCHRASVFVFASDVGNESCSAYRMRAILHRVDD